MSTTGGSAKAPTVLIYLVAIVVAVLIGAAAYFALVVREKRLAETYTDAAAKIEKELAGGRDYLRRHQNDKVTRAAVEATSNDVKRRIPFGPVDLTVGSYVDSAATQAGIQDEKWSVQGGLKPPRPSTDDKRTQIQRMSLDPAKLRLSTLDVEFSARFRETLALIKLLAQAPWLIEIVGLDMRRDPASAKINVHMTLRYLFE